MRSDPKNILGSGKLHPELARRVTLLLQEGQAEGLSLYLFEGFRSLDAQAKISSKNTRARAGYSFHNYGLAVDIVFRSEKGAPSWSEKHNWKRLGELGKGASLEWGGDWKRLVDRPHFQLSAGLAIRDIRELFRQGGLPRVWAAVTKRA